MFSALLSEIKGAFGKTYVLAGLMPAIVLVTGVVWFDTGKTVTSLISDLQPLFADPEAEGGSEVAEVAFVVLVIGLALFAARGGILNIVQDLPGRRWRLLRAWLVRWQLRTKLAAVRDHETRFRTWKLIDDWARRDFVATSVPPPVEPDPRRLPLASERARRIVAARGKSAYSLPSVRDVERIQGGLGLLYAAVSYKSDPDVCAAEVRDWRKLMVDAKNRRVVEMACHAAHRDWVDSARTLDQFPEQNTWVGPTRLGTLAAALDDYAVKRYGIDTWMLVTRLLGVLEDEERKALADSRLSVESLLNSSVALAVVAGWAAWDCVHIIVNAAMQSRLDGLVFDWRRAIFLAGALVGAFVLYRGAVFAFAGLAEKTKRAVDLNRLRLIKKLGFEVPGSASEERELWRQLHVFFYRGDELRPDPPLKLSD